MGCAGLLVLLLLSLRGALCGVVQWTEFEEAKVRLQLCFVIKYFLKVSSKNKGKNVACTGVFETIWLSERPRQSRRSVLPGGSH